MIIKYGETDFITSKANDLLPLECERCGRVFYAKKKDIKYELANRRGRLKYCSLECSNIAHTKKHIVECDECGKKIEIKDTAYRKSKTKHFFCSRSCSSKYNNKQRGSHTDETKSKISKSLCDHFLKINKKEKINKSKTIKGNKKDPKQKEKICKICGKRYRLCDVGATRKFCSKECSLEYKINRKNYLSSETISKLSNAGRKSATAQSLTRRSKNEMYFCKLCEGMFESVKHNEPLFDGWDADIIIDDIKVAILWNGIWHYQKITKDHSVSQVQNRDKIKISEIIKMGYTPYIIKDMGKFNKRFVEEEFEKFINNIVG